MKTRQQADPPSEFKALLPGVEAEQDLLPDSDQWLQGGLLTFYGYHVGALGKNEPERHEILKRAFNHDALPRPNPGPFVAEWGPAFSNSRLQRIASEIAYMCRNAKREKGSPKKNAIFDWEQDLSWLKGTFYDCRFLGEFGWPSTLTGQPAFDGQPDLFRIDSKRDVLNSNGCPEHHEQLLLPGFSLDQLVCKYHAPSPKHSPTRVTNPARTTVGIRPGPSEEHRDNGIWRRRSDKRASRSWGPWRPEFLR